MTLAQFAPREARFKTKIKGGRNVEITLRPFTLADKAWTEGQFSTEADQLAIAAMRVDPIARLVWHQMTQESREIFFRMKFVRHDENTGELIEAQPEGHERLIEAMVDEQDFLAAFEALATCRGLNGFVDDGVKKKTVKKTKTTGLNFMTRLRRRMA